MYLATYANDVVLYFSHPNPTSDILSNVFKGKLYFTFESVKLVDTNKKIV